MLKNALDWLVRSGELYEKPVALFNASPRATRAQASLIETLTVMTANLMTPAITTLPLMGRTLDENGILSNPELSIAIGSAVAALADSIRRHNTEALSEVGG